MAKLPPRPAQPFAGGHIASGVDDKKKKKRKTGANKQKTISSAHALYPHFSLSHVFYHPRVTQTTSSHCPQKRRGHASQLPLKRSIQVNQDLATPHPERKTKYTKQNNTTAKRAAAHSSIGSVEKEKESKRNAQLNQPFLIPPPPFFLAQKRFFLPFFFPDLSGTLFAARPRQLSIAA